MTGSATTSTPPDLHQGLVLVRWPTPVQRSDRGHGLVTLVPPICARVAAAARAPEDDGNEGQSLPHTGVASSHARRVQRCCGSGR